MLPKQGEVRDRPFVGTAAPTSRASLINAAWTRSIPKTVAITTAEPITESVVSLS